MRYWAEILSEHYLWERRKVAVEAGAQLIHSSRHVPAYIFSRSKNRRRQYTDRVYQPLERELCHSTIYLRKCRDFRRYANLSLILKSVFSD